MCLAYLRHYANDAQAVVQHRGIRRILDEETSAALFELLARPSESFRRKLVGGALLPAMRRPCEGGGRLYLNVGHTGLDQPGFRSWIGRTDVRPVYFVHDLIPITHPQYCRTGEREKHVERMETVLGNAVGVIANSRATVESLASFARSRELPVPRAIVAPLGSEALACGQALGKSAERPTFIVLGTIEARKNHLMLLQVWGRLIERLGEHAPRLIVIGQRGWECEEVLDLLDRSEALKTAVVELGQCDDETLASHFASARALLFPSLMEGYGLPLVEALRVGTPVIASDLPVFREIAGDVPDYLDPIDEMAWERAISAYSEPDSGARIAQMRRLADYQPPTWEDHFAAVDSWLAEL